MDMESTLLRMILGKEQCEEGSIHVPMDTELALSNNISNFLNRLWWKKSKQVSSLRKNNDKWKADFFFRDLVFLKWILQESARIFWRVSNSHQFGKMLIAEPDMLLLDGASQLSWYSLLRWLSRFLQKWNGVFLVTLTDPLWTKSVHTPWQFIDKNKKMKGGTRQMYRQIAHEETVYEQTRIAMEKKKAKSEVFIREFRSGARSTGLSAISYQDALEARNTTRTWKIPEILFRFRSEPFHAGTMLTCKQCLFWIRKENNPLWKN